MNNLIHRVTSMFKREDDTKVVNYLPEDLYYKRIDKAFYGLCGLKTEFIVVHKEMLYSEVFIECLLEGGFTQCTKEEYDKFNKD